MSKITAIVLAAGLGTRMKTNLPKVLHEVGSRTIFDRIILNIKATGIDEIIAVVGYKSEEIEKLYSGDITFVKQTELLGSGDALKRAIKALGGESENLLVTCGDTPLIKSETFKRILETHKKEKAACTVLTSIVDDPFSYGRIIRNDEGEIERITEEKDLTENEKKITEINTGTYCFRREDAEKFISEIQINEKKKEFYLTDIIDILKKEEKKVVSEACSKGEELGVNSRKDLANANKVINNMSLEKIMESGVTIIDPDTTRIDESAVIGKDTVIFSNTVIEKNVTVGGNCKIGPFARLRPGTKIDENVEIGNFVEINRSVIGNGTRIKHHTYLGDTIVGKNANIGAGTITANYDGKEKHRTKIEDGAFIGVGAILIAPVTIEKNAQVGAGSVITKNKVVPKGETWAGVPARSIVELRSEKGTKGK
ncbi:MAG: NTP transferase domain-containing protein [Candidatus Omnitrophica bacterium]|nr:NTP transferase domain-containing protein [Candidatus Omnitrophota bacterium]